MSIRAEILSQHGDELYYAQRSLVARFRAAVEADILVLDSGAHAAALDTLHHTDLQSIAHLYATLRTLMDWARDANVVTPAGDLERERLVAAAFWLADATADDKDLDQVAYCLSQLYHVLGIPSHAEAEQATSTRYAQLAWVDEDDDLYTGKVAELANHLNAAGHGFAPAIQSVYTVERGELVKVGYKTSSVPNHENLTAYVTVTVALPDDRRVEHSWTSDLAT